MAKKAAKKKARKLSRKTIAFSAPVLSELVNKPFHEFSDKALQVMKTHYLKKDLDGNFIETEPEEVFKRVIDFYYKNSSVLKSVCCDGDNDIFDIAKRAQRHQLFTFNSPTYYNADPKNDSANLFACFVGNLQDSMDSISKEIGRCVTIFKEGAGIGNNLGNLRPKGASIGDGGLHFQGESGSSGPLSFMSIFNETGVVVKSAGKRRAAIMTCMFDDHPEIVDFITCKSGEDRNSYTGMNLSLFVSDAFIEAIEKDDMWDLKWKDVVYKSMRARELFDLQCKQAWTTGDPGWLFRTPINQGNTTPSLGEIISTNPCGEVPLPPSTSCNLAAINLYQLSLQLSDHWGTFMSAISQLAKLIVLFISENAWLSRFPDKEFEDNTRFCGPLGLGISGFGEMLFKLGIRYGSSESQQLAKQIMEEVTLSGFEMSAQMAEVCGPCGAWECKENANALLSLLSKYASKSQNQTSRWQALINKVKHTGVRSMYISCIAPTGNTGIFSDSYSGGMEPLFALCYTRNLSTGGSLAFIDPEFELACDEYFEEEPDEKVEFLEEVKTAGGVLTDDIKDMFDIENEFNHFVTAHNLNWKDRIDMQAAFQEFCSLSISSTINLPESAKVEEIKELVSYAHRKNLKGVTIYRDGSLDETPLEIKKRDSAKEKSIEEWKRPQALNGETFRYTFNGQDVYITVNSSETEIVELFITINNCDADTRSFAESLTKRISKDLQKYHTPIQSICKDLIGVPSGRTERIRILGTDKKPVLVTSLPDLVGQVMRRVSIDKQEVQHIEGAKRCPKCLHFTALPEEGCLKCVNPNCLHVDCSI